MANENTELVEAYALIGREALPRMRQQDEGAPGAEAALANYPYGGQATISILGLGVGKLQVTATFDTGDKLQYNAWIYGAIVGAGGISFGGGAFDVPPSELLQGSTDCALTLTVAGVAIAFFRNGKLVGSFFGGGPNVGAGQAAGSGEWKRV
ncbi:MAG TPA: hypothetical protein VEW48_10505 [Thermoanaerobaculia bacterium]|nr:hypothetical protein [Thermoanaerobaculia bacterium]